MAFLIVGLGNPGRKYMKTRHNIGFLVADECAARWAVKFRKGRGPYETAETQFDEKVILAKPTTFMNNSGQAVIELMTYFNIAPEKTLIVYDDLDLPFGTLRLRAAGSAGGHNGLKSVIQHVNSKNLARLRIGIGTEFAKRDTTNFVLSRFSRNEQKELDSITSTAADAVEVFLRQGIDRAMNLFNQTVE